MKIIFINTLFPTASDRRATGGAETFLARLVQGLHTHGHAVSIVRSGTSRTESLEHTAEGVAIYTMPSLNVYPSSDGLKHSAPSRLAWHLLEDRGRVASAFRRVLQDVGPDLIHTNNVVGLTTDIWRVAHAAGIPIIHTLHDYYLTCPRVLRFDDGHRCAQTCRTCTFLTQQRRRATRNVDLVVGVSQRMLDIHRSEGLFLDTPHEVILNVPPPTPLAAPIRPRPLGDRPAFGFIGRQADEKGIFHLLEAFGRLGAGTATLRIAGAVDPAVQAWIKQNARSPGDIDLTGYIQPDAFFPTIDVAVFPSIWEEPCSMGVGEALAYGVPVLGSARGGTPELLEAGRLGWLFQPGNDELAATLARLVADPVEIATKAAIVRQLPRSTDDRLVRAYLHAYDRLSAGERLGMAAA